MNLKAAAQALGLKLKLDTGSTGWAILEKLSGFGSGAGDDDDRDFECDRDWKGSLDLFIFGFYFSIDSVVWDWEHAKIIVLTD